MVEFHAPLRQYPVQIKVGHGVPDLEEYSPGNDLLPKLHASKIHEGFKLSENLHRRLRKKQ